MSHSPLQIEVLLHHYYSPNSWDRERQPSPATKSAAAYWLSVGCMEQVCGQLKVTDRGYRMVAAWRETPLPTVSYEPQEG